MNLLEEDIQDFAKKSHPDEAPVTSNNGIGALGGNANSLSSAWGMFLGTGIGEEYVKLIWSETEIDEDDLSEIEDFDDPQEILTKVYTIINNNLSQVKKDISEFRKNLYLFFLSQLWTEEAQKKDFAGWLSSLNTHFRQKQEKKRKNLAIYLTRVLRGDLCRKGHHTVNDATNSLKSQKNVWEQFISEFNKLCMERKIFKS